MSRKSDSDRNAAARMKGRGGRSMSGAALADIWHGYERADETARDAEVADRVAAAKAEARRRANAAAPAPDAALADKGGGAI